jgi:predicted amidohydrolase YtcJ
LIDGKIYTMTKAQPLVEAVAIKGNRILKAGSTEEITYLIDQNTQIIYLEGSTVLPGFIDTHIHVADFGRFIMWMDLASAASINQMQVQLGMRLEKTAAGKWVVGRGWDEQRFTEKRLPTRYDLDMVSPNNPVLFYHQSGQIALANSKALELAGVTKATDPPLGGFIDKNPETEEPTGVLRETATDLVWKMVPETGMDELVDAAALACEKIVQAGITSIHWLAESASDVAILKRLVAAGKLPLRVYMVVPASLLGDSALLDGLQESFVKIGAVEVQVDGYLASRTAALAKPYHDEENGGKLLCTQTELKEAAKNVVSKGFQLVLHAMGDKAVDTALNVVEATEQAGRVRIDPAALLNPALIQRLKQLKVVVSIQPLVAASEFSIYDAMDHLGEDRARWLYPLKTLLNEGVRVCGGSDCPMEPLNPLLSIQSAATRRFFPEEQLTVDDALKMYTVNAAYASCDEKEKGTIEEGKLADLTVLSQDPHETTSRIQDIAIELTIIDGKVAYSTQN